MSLENFSKKAQYETFPISNFLASMIFEQMIRNAVVARTSNLVVAIPGVSVYHDTPCKIRPLVVWSDVCKVDEGVD